jgi:hypothetical protein
MERHNVEVFRDQQAAYLILVVILSSQIQFNALRASALPAHTTRTPLLDALWAQSPAECRVGSRSRAARFPSLTRNSWLLAHERLNS